MLAKKGTAHENIDDFDIGQSTKRVERGYYGRALREGRVQRAPWEGQGPVITLLWVLNIIAALLLVGYGIWRLYVYLSGLL